MISAIVLAAGQSTRMGEYKMLLPWGQTSVIGHVVATILEAGVNDVYAVTGGHQIELKEALKEYKINYLYNQDFEDGEMLTSVQVGLSGLGNECDAALIVLGDQPQIESRVVREIVERNVSTHHKIIVPSYKMHRGHPWLIEKLFWKDILNLLPPQSLRNFLNMHYEVIDYLNVETPSVLQDLDTKNDYSHYKP